MAASKGTWLGCHYQPHGFLGGLWNVRGALSPTNAMKRFLLVGVGRGRGEDRSPQTDQQTDCGHQSQGWKG